MALVLRAPCHAAQLDVTPRVLTVDAKHPIAELSISSLRARPVIFDTTIERWEQHGAGDVYTASAAFAVVPSVLTVNPYATQTLRLALRSAAADDTETAYRLRVIEVIPGNATPGPTARVFSIPLFVVPSTIRGDVHYELRKRAGAGYAIVVRNNSNVHAYVEKVSIESGGREIYTGTVNAFVLAGNTRTIPVTIASPLAGPATVHVLP